MLLTFPLHIWFSPSDSVFLIKTMIDVILANIADSLRHVLCRVFDHWEMITQDPMKPDSPSNVIMLDVRKRKGLKEQPNPITEYEDKL